MDVDQLVAPVSDEEPCGENLEYEPEFGELERASQGKAAQVMGDEEIEAEPPDWATVYRLGQELFERSNDLRIAVLLTRAALNQAGPEGLVDGLTVFSRLLEEYWDSVHPQLDEDDDYDPMLRLNSILPLSDPEGMVADLLGMELVASRAVGKFTLRDVKVANGELSPLPDQENVPDSALITAAFMDADLDDIQANSDKIVEAVELVRKSEAAILEQVGDAVAPSFDALVDELTEIQGIYAEKLTARGVATEAPGQEGGGEAAAAAPGTTGTAISGDIQGRDDVVRMIDKICLFYERAEPSSPVPLLLQRAKRLVNMNYLDIMRDLAPDGVHQAEAIGGVQSEQQSEY